MSKMPGPKHLLPSRRHCSFSMRADGMDGVEMAGDQDAGLALLGMRKARADAAGKTLPSGDALDRRTHDRHLARGNVEHALDRACVPGRAFAFHPAAQPCSMASESNGRLAGFMDVSLWFRRADISAARTAYENDRQRICKVETCAWPHRMRSHAV